MRADVRHEPNPALPEWPEDERARGLREAALWEKWRYAAKPASWPKLLVPVAIGHALAALDARELSISALGLGVLHVIALLAAIVFLNDAFDARVDRIKREMFPKGCSPKTIPDGILSRRALMIGGSVALVVSVGVAAVVGQVLPRPRALTLGVGCAFIFIAYSLPPIRLNYRGGGELLEMLGVGVVLPAFAAYVQSGVLMPGALMVVLPGFASLSLASALASGLSDERSDREGGKRTFATMLGNARTRRALEAAVVVGAALFVVMPATMRDWLGVGAGLVGAALALKFLRAMRAVDPPPVTDAFASQGIYKGHLHAAIWGGALALVFARVGLAAMRLGVEGSR